MPRRWTRPTATPTAGHPVKVGSRAVSALPAAVRQRDRANDISDLFGRLLVAYVDPAMVSQKNLTYTSTADRNRCLESGLGEEDRRHLGRHRDLRNHDRQGDPVVRSDR